MKSVIFHNIFFHIISTPVFNIVFDKRPTIFLCRTLTVLKESKKSFATLSILGLASDNPERPNSEELAMTTNDDLPPITIHLPPSTITSSSTVVLKKENYSPESGFFGKSRPYKFWALTAILLLAFWSMFTGSVTLKWSTGDLTRFSGDTDSLIHDDLDILELEERQKVVRHMWDVYTQSKSIRLPKFWQEAFEAAYDLLVSDTPGVREAAVSEIAKMSMSSISLYPLAGHSQSTRRSRKNPEQVKKVKEENTIGSGDSS